MKLLYDHTQRRSSTYLRCHYAVWEASPNQFYSLSHYPKDRFVTLCIGDELAQGTFKRRDPLPCIITTDADTYQIRVNRKESWEAMKAHLPDWLMEILL